MAFDSGFNPVYFMYLNPELCISSNISTVEQALQFWNAAPKPAPWHTNIDFIPSALDEAAFIGDNKAKMNISALNKQIYQTMSNQGYTVNDLNKISTYSIPTIYKSVYFTGASNTLKFNNPGDSNLFYINYSNLNIGDEIKIVREKATVIHTRVTSILDNQTFMVDTPCINKPAQYLLHGIKLYDPLRIARINHLAIYPPSPVDEVEIVNVEPEFNYNLYTLLYPDSRVLTKEAAFVDYINRYGNNDARIGNVKDLNANTHCCQQHEHYNYANVNSLEVENVFHLSFGQESGRFVWNDVTMYYVTDEPNRPLSMVSPYFQGLVTEYAIKMYLNNLIFPNFTISNLHVKGNAIFDELCTIDTLVVEDTASIANLVGQHIEFSNANVQETLAVGGRIGIGYDSISPQNVYAYEPISSCNVSIENGTVSDTLYVGDIAQIGNELICNRATFGSAVTGPRFGVGYDNGALDEAEASEASHPTVSSLVVTSNLAATTTTFGWSTIMNATVSNTLTAFDVFASNADTHNITAWSNMSCPGLLSCARGNIAHLTIGEDMFTPLLNSTTVNGSNINGSNITGQECTIRGQVYCHTMVCNTFEAAGAPLPYVSWRRGGHSNDWSIAGSNNYIQSSPMTIQCGVYKAPSSNVTHFEHFPVPFDAPPILTLTPSTREAFIESFVTHSNGFEIMVDTTHTIVNWIAIGPGKAANFTSNLNCL